MQPTQLEPGMRVRCVRPNGELQVGAEYRIGAYDEGVHYLCVEGSKTWWYAERFKPVVRVKAYGVRMRHIFDTCHGQ